VRDRHVTPRRSRRSQLSRSPRRTVPGTLKDSPRDSPRELSLRWLTRPDEVSSRLREALTICWRDVANDGGAVGFAELLPGDRDDVRPVVDEMAAGMDPRLSRMLIATRDHSVGAGCS
jgi:hypothetical protein